MFIMKSILFDKISGIGLKPAFEAVLIAPGYYFSLQLLGFSPIRITIPYRYFYNNLIIFLFFSGNRENKIN
jgi:hypothetical protein